MSMTQDAGGPFAVRGAIEGFYGRPYSWAEREALVGFLAAKGMNTYVYAPKSDALHRERWRDPYDATARAAFVHLAEQSRAAGVDLFYALAPGLTYDATDPRDLARLESKLGQLLDCGISGVALLFDDIAADSPADDPDVQAELIGRIHRWLTRRAPEVAFWFIGNFYAGTARELSAGEGVFAQIYRRRAQDYLEAYARAIDASVPMMWTGPGVFSETVSLDDARAIRELVRRPVVLWDNFPVNDALPRSVFLGPYRNRDPRLPEALHGVVANLMSQPAASRIALTTVCDYLCDPSGYDPEGSVERALRELAGADAAILRALGVLVDLLGGHPVLARELAAPELAARTREAFSREEDTASLASLESYLEVAAGSGEVLRSALSDREAAFVAELAPWLEKIGLLARAAREGLSALAGRATAEGFRALRAEAEARPEAVGSTHLADALKPFTSGDGPAVDRFAELFAAIEKVLASDDQRAASRRVT